MPQHLNGQEMYKQGLALQKQRLAAFPSPDIHSQPPQRFPFCPFPLEFNLHGPGLGCLEQHEEITSAVYVREAPN